MIAAAATVATAQEPRPDASMQQQIARIAQERNPQMENAARAFVFNFDPARECIAMSCPVLDSLRARNVNAYWMEIAQLAMQFEMFQSVVQRDTTRARLMLGLFKSEFEAREVQRAWRDATEVQRRALRARLENVMGQHFDLEEQLRGLEMRDIRRRLAAAEAETERRRSRRAEMVRWAVDDVIHGAQRPLD